jgi:hypothetical protein
MANTTNTKRTPIEVWLRQANIAVTCTVACEDETTYTLDVDSMSLRGAQREITGYLISDGYAPVGRWEWTAEGSEDWVECTRTFRPIPEMVEQ